MRVVRSEEILERNRFHEGKSEVHSTNHEWLWITTLPSSAFPSKTIRQLGHQRWKNENNGWMDLTKHWAFQHGFLHACQHRPKQRTPSGQREPVPNGGLAAVTLILLIAAALSGCFVLRHSKLARRDHLTAVAVAAQLHAWISRLRPAFELRTKAPARPLTGQLLPSACLSSQRLPARVSFRASLRPSPPSERPFRFQQPELVSPIPFPPGQYSSANSPSWLCEVPAA